MPKNVALPGPQWPTQVGMHSFMATLAVTGHPGPAAVLYGLTILLSAVVELSHSPAAEIICKKWRFGKHRR
jgi:hypothetical protein